MGKPRGGWQTFRRNDGYLRTASGQLNNDKCNSEGGCRIPTLALPFVSICVMSGCGSAGAAWISSVSSAAGCGTARASVTPKVFRFFVGAVLEMPERYPRGCLVRGVDARIGVVLAAGGLVVSARCSVKFGRGCVVGKGKILFGCRWWGKGSKPGGGEGLRNRVEGGESYLGNSSLVARGCGRTVAELCGSTVGVWWDRRCAMVLKVTGV
ncbi:hypothetical protein L6452_35375 [Arctium lappa]|uniref:Uncharacterized protein n=1 Tax=Arctium lappa TaxID=4217 RepID=A0ACB8Y7S2_ARCLA|nr:hypothetical protein L6452_35375 [Arctium lappa]